jgi:taurine dioxygenase
MLVERLNGPFGVAVRGLDLRTGADADTMRRLVGLLHEHRIVAISGQSLTQDQYLAFGRQWGRPHAHVLTHKRMPGYPEMMTVGNTFKRAANDAPAVFWHTDQSYEAEPASCTMLYAIMAPEVGGETAFADMVAAYEALDDATKRRIAPLEAVHLYGAASGRDGENRASAMISDEQRRSAPPVAHPIVLRHPVTGRKALYAVAGTPFAIRGMPDDEAERLLRDLKQHALQPRFAYKYKYSVGDIAIWDTFATLHSATPIAPATGPRDSRLLWRISCKGLPPCIAGATAPHRGVAA